MTEPDGTTPLDPDDAEGLRLSYIATRAELDEAEAANIAAGFQWAARRRLGPADVLDDLFLRELHRRMFGAVWAWAGTYRHSNKNIGDVQWTAVPTSVRDLVADARVWVASRGPGVEPSDELSIRFHHRLVWIHPFVNGNGRHSRAAADLLVEACGGRRFSWGRSGLTSPGEIRSRYIAALQGADRSGDLRALLAFARS